MIGDEDTLMISDTFEAMIVWMDEENLLLHKKYELHIYTQKVQGKITKIEFIKNMQTPFPKYTPEFRKHSIEVIVEVSSAKARLFRAKNHLASQKEVEQKDDGTLLLSFKVSQELEMEELVKKWIPHMKVVSPLSLKRKIEDDLRVYLNT